MRDSTTRASAAALALAALALTAGGCGRGGSKPPSCKGAAAAFALLQQKEIEKPYSQAPAPGSPAAPDEKAKALALIPLVKEALEKECEEKKWSGEARRCVVEAKTMDDLERCRIHGDEATAPAAGAEKPPETAPAPAKSDSQ